MSDQQHLFCARLKAIREQKGISLQHIAAATNISASVFQGLEQNNLSRWPKGLYRRAYLRDYLTALGLSPEPVVEEFRRLFPVDEDDAFLRIEPPATSVDATAEPGHMPAAVPMPLRQRMLASLLDATLAIALAVVVVAVTGGPLWTGTIVVLCYYVGTTAWLGRGLGVHSIARRVGKEAETHLPVIPPVGAILPRALASTARVWRRVSDAIPARDDATNRRGHRHRAIPAGSPRNRHDHRRATVLRIRVRR